MIFIKRLQSCIRKTPIFGELFQHRRSEHYTLAFSELFVTLIVATSPMWLGIICIFLVGHSDDINLTKALYTITKNGELFLYSTSIIAPVIYIATQHIEGAKTFPHRTSHIVVILIIIAVAALAFGLIRADEVNINFNIKLSIITFVVSIILVYVALVYRNERMATSAEDFKTDEKNFYERYENHR